MTMSVQTRALQTFAVSQSNVALLSYCCGHDITFDDANTKIQPLMAEPAREAVQLDQRALR